MSNTKDQFVKNPEKDFSRNRKLTFEKMIELILTMGGGNLSKELLEYSGYAIETATTSAFVQQREKIKSSAFEYLLNEFINSFEDIQSYEGYKLLASDGTNLNIPRDPNDADTYYQAKHGARGYNLLHSNAIYDLCTKLYVDAYIQPSRKENEHRALAYMIDRSRITENAILITDRGYESYNVLAHIAEKGWKYVIRVKDVDSYGILSGLRLPDEPEFVKEIHLTLTRKQTNTVKSQSDIYKFLPKGVVFDYLDQNNLFYSISFRAVRLKLSDGVYETLITNLHSTEFPLTNSKCYTTCVGGLKFRSVI